MRIDGRLHANGAQQLQGVVLNHVAHCAGVFVKRAAAFDAQIFRNADLDIGNVLPTPQGFKERVAKTHRKQILNRWFAQVMVDPENLGFVEVLAHGAVDGPVGFQVVAERLFQHHPCFSGVQAGCGELFTDRGEQRRCRGHVHDDGVGIAFVERAGQRCVVVWLGQVHADELQQCGKPGKFFCARAFSEVHLVKAGLNETAVLVMRHAVATHPNNAPTFGQGSVAVCLEKCGHQFAPGQIAGATKQNEVKAHDDLKLHKY